MDNSFEIKPNGNGVIAGELSFAVNPKTNYLVIRLNNSALPKIIESDSSDVIRISVNGESNQIGSVSFKEYSEQKSDITIENVDIEGCLIIVPQDISLIVRVIDNQSGEIIKSDGRSELLIW
ncbi:MAG: hypothetical protein Q4G05_01155 [Clostridia bacterium]|nr:hypothetical protein [Clostridia bacterium]